MFGAASPANCYCSGEEVEYSTDEDWQALTYHPQSIEMEALRRDWRAKHPNVSETSGPTADIANEDEDDEALEQQLVTETRE